MRVFRSIVVFSFLCSAKANRDSYTLKIYVKQSLYDVLLIAGVKGVVAVARHLEGLINLESVKNSNTSRNIISLAITPSLYYYNIICLNVFHCVE